MEKGTIPFETLHIDHFGPLEKTEDNYLHVLIIIDAFTKFTWLFATKSTRSLEAIGHLTYLFTMFGTPKRVISDRGTAFTSKQFEAFLEQWRVQHVKIAVASPWANGQVERVNRFLKSTMIKLVDKSADWKKNLE